MRIGYVMMLVALMTACGSIGAIESELDDFKDIKRAERRSDGLYNVVCMDDSFEIGVTREQIINNHVCAISGSPPRIDRVALLRDLGNVLSEASDDFFAKTRDVVANLGAYCESPQASDYVNLKNQWKKMALKWEEIELLQIGPLAQNGKDLRYQIQGWPAQAHLCRINQEVLRAHREGASYTLPPNTNRKGLQAFEYILFNDELQPACTLSGSDLAEWKKLSSIEKHNARCHYLNAVAIDLSLQAEMLTKNWGPINDHAFTRHNGVPQTINIMTQELFENVFYVSPVLRKNKLAAPAGIDTDQCPPGTNCVSRQQYNFSDISLEAVQRNIVAFNLLMQGSDGQSGFNALVRDTNARGRQVSERMQAELGLLLETALEPQETLTSLAEKAPTGSCQALEDQNWFCRMDRILNRIDADLRREYTALLNLELPQTPGDND